MLFKLSNRVTSRPDNQCHHHFSKSYGIMLKSEGIVMGCITASSLDQLGRFLKIYPGKVMAHPCSKPSQEIELISTRQTSSFKFLALVSILQISTSSCSRNTQAASCFHKVKRTRLRGWSKSPTESPAWSRSSSIIGTRGHASLIIFNRLTGWTNWIEITTSINISQRHIAICNTAYPKRSWSTPKTTRSIFWINYKRNNQHVKPKLKPNL